MPNPSWVAGHSGNPGGRPKMDPEFKWILKTACPKAAMKLVELLDSKNPRIVISAAEAIINRIYGKPRESVDMKLNQEDDTQLQVRSVILQELKKKQNDSERECNREYEFSDDSDEYRGEQTISIKFASQ